MTPLLLPVARLGAMGLFLWQVLRALPTRAARTGTLAGLISTDQLLKTHGHAPETILEKIPRC